MGARFRRFKRRLQEATSLAHEPSSDSPAAPSSPSSVTKKGSSAGSKSRKVKLKLSTLLVKGFEQTRKTLRTLLRKPLNRRQKRILYATALGIIIFSLLAVVIGKPLLAFVSDPSILKSWAERDPLIASLAFLGLMVIQIVIAFIPGEPLQLAAGYSFGLVWGTVLCVLGALIGSSIVFLLVKRFGLKLLHVFFSDDDLKAFVFFNDPKRRNALTFILMFIPGTPKDLFTYMLPLTPMNLSTWLFISIPARMLGIVGSTLIGSQFAANNHLVAIGISIVAVICSVAGILYYKNLVQEQERKRLLASEETLKRAAAAARATMAPNTYPTPKNDSPAEKTGESKSS